MNVRTSFVVIGVSVAISLGAVFVLQSMNAQEPAKIPDATPARFSVSTEVLPGHLSITLFYIADAKTDKLHICRAIGGMDASLKSDPELYRTFDLTTVGQKNLKQAK